MALPESLQQRILERFQLSHDGFHGPHHWERVRENGLFLARRTSADVSVVEAFSWLHDSCRQNEGRDPAHGHRATDFVTELHVEGHLELSEEQQELLVEACRYHSQGKTEADVTVQVCWDADRLDLGRVGTRPDPEYLCTEVARRRKTIRWAYARSLGEHGDFPDP